MRRSFFTLPLAVLLFGSLSTTALAQENTPDQQTRPPQPQPQPRPAQPAPPRAPAAPRQFHIRPFVGLDLHSMAASQSFNAALDSSRMTGFGAGADFWGFYRNVFARVGFATASKTGSRGFLSGNAVIQTGVAMDVTITPVQIGAGWRFTPKPRTAAPPRPGTPAPAPPRPAPPAPPRPGAQPAPPARPPAPAVSRFTPYVGGGLVLLKYKESSEFAASGDDVSSSHRGGTIFGGVDVSITRLFVVTAEAEFRRVGHTPGPGSLSDVFGEDDLGGFGFRLLFGIRK